MKLVLADNISFIVKTKLVVIADTIQTETLEGFFVEDERIVGGNDRTRWTLIAVVDKLGMF